MSPQRTILSLTLALAAALAQALPGPDEAQAARWPVKGRIVQQKLVKDRLGAGRVIYAAEQSSAGQGQTTLLHAYRYNGDPEDAELIWIVSDGIENCALKQEARFAAGAPVTTDLDGDGLLEIWTGCIAACSDSPGPMNLTLTMYEGRDRHVMRGTTFAEVEPGVSEGGRGDMDTAFRTGPAVFRKYAEELWHQWAFGTAQPAPASWPARGEAAWVEPVADRLGEGAVVYSREAREGEGWKTILLHACRFRGEPASATPVWQFSDGVERCGLKQASARFLGDGPELTDLDRDGIKEIWTVYASACAGGPGPEDLKIVMYEGKEKYAMHGSTSARTAEGAWQDGEGKMDEAFLKGPAVFRRYAERLWRRFRTGQDAG